MSTQEIILGFLIFGVFVPLFFNCTSTLKGTFTLKVLNIITIMTHAVLAKEFFCNNIVSIIIFMFGLLMIFGKYSFKKFFNK